MNCRYLLNEDFIKDHEDFMTLTEDNNEIDETVAYLSEAYEEFNAIFTILENEFMLLEDTNDNDDKKGKPRDDDPPKPGGNGTGLPDPTLKTLQNMNQTLRSIQDGFNDIAREKRTEVSASQIRNAVGSDKRSGEIAELTALASIQNFAKEAGLDISLDKKSSTENLEYMPAVGLVKKENIKDMGFPKNVIFFIGSLIDWIKRLIVSFIIKIGNVIKLLFGYDKKELLDAGDTKFYLDKFTKMQATGTQLTKDKDKLISIAEVPYTDVKRMFSTVGFNESDESVLNEFKLDDRDETGANKKTGTVPFVQINLSDDMTDLKVSLDHFFNIFESSYGSNNEYLFGTEDLEMLLGVFKDALKKIERHDVSPFYVAGKKALPLIDSNRLANGLQTTAVNTDKLKELYRNINDRVQKILKKITAKQLMVSSELGGAYKFYSLSTYAEMKRILDILNPKIKEMVKMENELSKIKTKFEKITADLAKLQKAFTGMTAVVYREGFNNSMSELFRSARIVTQTVTLRLTTLTMAIKTLRDIKDAIEVAISINKKSFEDVRKTIKSLR